MERLLKEEPLPSMRLGLTLTTDAVKIEMDVEIEVEKKIDATGVIDAAEGVINKKQSGLILEKMKKPFWSTFTP
jgi:hypothetical protein